jgi:hypothetical protein
MFENVVDADTLLQDADRFMKAAQEVEGKDVRYEVDVRYATSEELQDLGWLKGVDMLLDSWCVGGMTC